MAANPFTITTLNSDSPFCNRVREQEELRRYALSGTNVVLYSPRRYGKTSLVYKIQSALVVDHIIPVFADFYGVDSVEDVAARLARAVFAVTHRDETVWQVALRVIKSFRPVLKPEADGGFSLSVEQAGASLRGLDLLNATMESLGAFIAQSGKRVNVCLDEFQEIVELKESAQIEALMRTHIQNQTASYFFVGSRRSILLEMFNNPDRPFFQSAFNYEIKALPREEYAKFIKGLFEQAGVGCSSEVALQLVDSVEGHPFYVQKLAYVVYDHCGKVVMAEIVKQSELALIQIDKPVFEAKLQGLTLQQKRVIKALAIDPINQPLSTHYLALHNLGSAGGVRNALNALSRQDVIEKSDETGMWKVIDPLFRRSLRESVVSLLV